jgi:cell division protein ZapA
MKRFLNVEISGQSFTISSDAEESYVLKVAGYVDQKMQELSRGSKPTAKSNVATLTALNIADEYHRLKEAHETVLKRLSQLSKQVSGKLSEEA